MGETNLLDEQPEEVAAQHTKLALLRFAYFLLGFWCGIIVILSILLIISFMYGFG